ncbi:hypothetical protein BH18ACT8_BH18ACT8_05470 [soil metagenome]
MDVSVKLAQARRRVERARGLPMSSSCVLNRAELLDQLDELATMLRTALEAANTVVTDRDDVVAQGRADAERIVAQAYVEHERLICETEVYRQAQRISDDVLSVAREEAATLRREIDEYVDERFASLELSLQKTLDAVARGRRHLQGRSEFEELRAPSVTALPDPFAD